jgi:selenocysteine lyase/cysteine desulfurase
MEFVDAMVDLETLRADFPITQKYNNLDNASLSPLPLPVVRAVEKMLSERSQLGVDAFWPWVTISDETRALIAGLINAEPEEIALIQNTSEGINIVATMLDWRTGDNVVVSNLEFGPNYWPWLRLRKMGVEVRLVEHRDGLITTEDFAARVDGRTRVLAVSSVAWTNGLRHDLPALAEVVHSHAGYLAVDGIQQVGNSRLDVRQGPVDFLSCGGHKWLFGLLGTGFFFCRRDLITQYEPVYVSWQSDAERFDYTFREYSLSPTARRFNHGNTSVAGHHALHAGISYINRIGLDAIESRIGRLTHRLIAGLRPLGVRFLSPLQDRYRSAIVNFIPRDAQALVEQARARNILACVRQGGVRVSPSFYNTEDEVDQLIELTEQIQNGEC